MPLNPIVASAVIFGTEGDTKDKVLLIRLNKETSAGVWVPPGGKVETGEQARDCAIRETYEELGIKIEIDGIYGLYEKTYGDEIWTFILYKAHVVDGTPKSQEPGKVVEVKWVPEEEFKEHLQETTENLCLCK